MTPKEESVISYLKGLGSQVLDLNNGQWFPSNRIIQFTFAQITREYFQNIFPTCKNIDRILRDGYHVRKFFHRQPRTVTFLAMFHDIQDPVGNDTATLGGMLNHFTVRNDYIGRSTCADGEITDLEVEFRQNPLRRMNRCGFGSMLSYLCFMDSDHLTHPSGYQIEQKRKQDRDNPWNLFTMRAIKQDPVGFNNDECKIIYVKYQDKKGRWEPSGSKALLYAAYAADYTELVTYTPRPDCITNWSNGNTFQVKDVFQKVSQPHRLSPITRINEILEPFGVDWYFGKRQTIEQLIKQWKKNNTEN